MSSDNGITIDRKTLKAYHWQGDGVQPEDEPIATGINLDDLIDSVHEWIEKQKEGCGYFELEYGINFIN